MVSSFFSKFKKVKYPYEYIGLPQRLNQQKGSESAINGDDLLEKLLKNSESMFIPKKVNSRNDWLKEHRENGQSIQRYSQGGPDIAWLNKFRDTIYVFILDLKLDEHVQQLIKEYVEAFFLGSKVQVVSSGGKLREKTRGGVTKVKTFPSEFVEHHNIASR